MSREILFKAKRIDNGEWATGSYNYDYRNNRYFIITNECACPNAGFKPLRCEYQMSDYDIDPSTICQYTGLTDKNGQKIWEGDIILAGHYKWKCKVVWDKKCARFIGVTNDKDVKIVYVDMVDKNNVSAVEVIGNIHDNPSLLESY